jgi:hypothetical protein
VRRPWLAERTKTKLAENPKVTVKLAAAPAGVLCVCVCVCVCRSCAFDVQFSHSRTREVAVNVYAQAYVCFHYTAHAQHTHITRTYHTHAQLVCNVVALVNTQVIAMSSNRKRKETQERDHDRLEKEGDTPAHTCAAHPFCCPRTPVFSASCVAAKRDNDVIFGRTAQILESEDPPPCPECPGCYMEVSCLSADGWCDNAISSNPSTCCKPQGISWRKGLIRAYEWRFSCPRDRNLSICMPCAGVDTMAIGNRAETEWVNIVCMKNYECIKAHRHSGRCMIRNDASEIRAATIAKFEKEARDAGSIHEE